MFTHNYHILQELLELPCDFKHALKYVNNFCNTVLSSAKNNSLTSNNTPSTTPMLPNDTCYMASLHIQIVHILTNN